MYKTYKSTCCLCYSTLVYKINGIPDKEVGKPIYFKSVCTCFLGLRRVYRDSYLWQTRKNTLEKILLK